jgi:hypothetical protein
MKDRESTVDERFGGLFQPDTLLPSQFFDRMRRRSEHDGERRLMIAVLEDAVDVYRKQAGATDPRGRELFHAAEVWIEDPDRTWLFSFQNICDVLDIDADYLRRGLHLWKQRAQQGGRRGQVVTLRSDERDELRKASGD